MNIAVIVPANVPYNHCTILSPGSLAELEKLRGPAIVHVVGQGAFMTSMPEELPKNVYVTEEPESCPARMAYLRQQGAYWEDGAHYYIMADANMEFVPGSATMLQQCIDFLEEDHRFGAVACTGSFGGNASGRNIIYYKAGKIISTAKGIVIRNDYAGQLFEESALECLGGLEEHLMCVFLNRRGKSIAKQFFHPTKHYDLWKTHRPDEPRHNQIHNLAVSTEQGAIKWIRDNVRPGYKFGDRIVNIAYEPDGTASHPVRLAEI
jgi:hypothetical protein